MIIYTPTKRRNNANQYRGLYKFHQRQRNGECPKKDEVRNETVNYVYEYFKDRRDNVSFLTLPGIQWTFEYSIYDLFYSSPRRERPNLYFTACERDWTTFCLSALEMPCKKNGGIKFPQKQIMSEKLNCQIIKKDSTTIINKDIFDYIPLSPLKFDCIWADTVTPLSFIGDKLKSVNRVFKDRGGLFILTALKCRDHEEITDRVEYAKKLLPTFTLITHYEYMDTSPMIHFIFEKMCY